MPINAQSAQSFVPIKEIRNGVVILKDNSLRALLMASSINIALKSADEQSAILLQFQNFLNSLDFSIQFFIESRRLDIRPYVALMEEKFAEQTNELMKIQTREYIEFIKAFTEESEIMSKTFFVVVPYEPAVVSTSGGLSSLFKKKDEATKNSSEDTAFQENLTQLEQRVAIVEQGLMRTGVRAVRLEAEELIELYYKIFNPGDLEKPISLDK